MRGTCAGGPRRLLPHLRRDGSNLSAAHPSACARCVITRLLPRHRAPPATPLPRMARSLSNRGIIGRTRRQAQLAGGGEAIWRTVADRGINISAKVATCCLPCSHVTPRVADGMLGAASRYAAREHQRHQYHRALYRHEKTSSDVLLLRQRKTGRRIRSLRRTLILYRAG